MTNQIPSGKKQNLAKRLAVVFAVAVGLVFLIEIVAIPLSYKGDNPELGLQNPDVKFNSTWIFGSNLTENEKSSLIGANRVVATYYYNSSPDFFELETMVSGFQGQVILEKVNSDKTELELQSSRDRTTVDNLTKENLFRSFCMVLALPPPDCSSFQ